MNKSEMIRDLEKALENNKQLKDVKVKYNYKQGRFECKFIVKFVSEKDTFNKWNSKALKKAKKIARLVETFDIKYVGSNWQWNNFYEEQNVRLYFKTWGRVK